MTYKELAKQIAEMSEEQQNCDVTIHLIVTHEFLASPLVSYATESNDVLDEGHPCLPVLA